MRPGAKATSKSSQPHNIAKLPTPHLNKYCELGQFNVNWSVNEGKAHINLPDLTLGFRIEALTMSGIQTIELNRFDAAARFVPWDNGFQPTKCQKMLMAKVFGFILSDWREDLNLRTLPLNQNSLNAGRPVNAPPPTSTIGAPPQVAAVAPTVSRMPPPPPPPGPAFQPSTLAHSHPHMVSILNPPSMMNSALQAPHPPPMYNSHQHFNPVINQHYPVPPPPLMTPHFQRPTASLIDRNLAMGIQTQGLGLPWDYSLRRQLVESPEEGPLEIDMDPTPSNSEGDDNPIEVDNPRSPRPIDIRPDSPRPQPPRPNTPIPSTSTENISARPHAPLSPIREETLHVTLKRARVQIDKITPESWEIVDCPRSKTRRNSSSSKNIKNTSPNPDKGKSSPKFGRRPKLGN